MPNGSGTGLYIRNNKYKVFNGGWLQGSSGNTNLSNTIVTNNDVLSNGNNTPSWPAGNPTAYTYSNNLSVNPLFSNLLSYLLLPLLR